MEALRRFREEQGKTRREMAQMLGISHSFYEKIELGERSISGNFLRKLKNKFPTIDINIFFAK